MLRLACSAAVLAIVASANSAKAQQIHASGAADLLLGVEGGASGYAAGVRRARTTLRFGGEGYLDESPKHWFGVGALIEVEPRASFGADVRYLLRFRDTMALQAGVTTILAPNYMIGGSFGYAYRKELSPGIELNVNPLVNVYFLGGDLPKDTVIWQGMIAAGARFALF